MHRFYGFAEHFVIHLATMLKHIADGALAIINSKGNTVFCDYGLIDIVFNIIKLDRYGCIKSA